MPSFHSMPSRAIPRIARSRPTRGRRARRGSILILVVALLVLMALIGTAFLTTSRTDRQAAAQNTTTAQADLLAESLVALCQQRAVNALGPPTSPGSTLPNAQNFRPAGYNTWDSASVDTFLADRIPAGPSSVPQGATQLPICWLYVSSSPFQYPNGTQFESPAGDPPATSRRFLTPTSRTISYPDGSSRIFPAFRIADSADPNGGNFILAADCDADGIADAGLFRFPIEQINGITWYGAIRMIDNGSAVNAAVAWKWNDDAAYAGNNFFPSNIDLKNLLTYPAEVDSLNTWRFTTATAGSTIPATATDTQGTGTYDPAMAGAAGSFTYASPYEALWSQVGNRINNPGWNQAGSSNPLTGKFRALSVSDSAALASHFCLSNRNALPATVEQYLAKSIYFGNPITTGAFSPNDPNTWWTTLFDYSSSSLNALPPRALLTARNGVTNFTPNVYPFRTGNAHLMGDQMLGDNGRIYVCIQTATANGPPGGAVVVPPATASNDTMEWALMPWITHPTRVSVNTATFGQLAAAYWAVMSDVTTTLQIPEQRQFKGTLFRNAAPGAGGPAAQTSLTLKQMIQLRASLAAVNTIDLRDVDEDVTSRTIYLTDDAGTRQHRVDIYGTEKQPYITEVFVHTSIDARSYVAIELYNPYPTAISLKGWKLAARDLASGGGTMDLVRALDDVNIPPGQHVVLENDASLRPSDVAPTTVVTATELEGAFTPGTKELYLLRTRRADGTASTSNNPANSFNETNLIDMVPADQIDCRGLSLPLNDPTTGVRPKKPDGSFVEARYHYARADRATTGTDSAAWHFVYPGKSANTPYLGTAGPFMEGWVFEKKTDGFVDPGLGNFKNKQGGAAPTATYKTRALQVNAPNAAGPNGGTQVFPYGGFARNGDILQVTFIGGYRIAAPDNSAPNATPAAPAAFTAMNGIGLDSFFANDAPADAADDDDELGGIPLENLGRFCPLDRPDGTADDYGNDPAAWRYRFAMDLFDYLTVQSPQQDYYPNVDPNSTSGDPTVPGSNMKWPAVPQAVANSTFRDPLRANQMNVSAGSTVGNEDAASTQGLININTAPWRVLATLPMVPTDRATNNKLAQAIWYYRDINDGSGNPHGPFKNLFELQKVIDVTNTAAGFRNAYGTFDVTADGDDATGDLSPAGVGNQDYVSGDFESRYQVLNRISNLITTRSDSFTAYVLVQGWRDAGTGTPTLVVQKRMAVILDRAVVQPRRPDLTSTLTPIGRSNIPQ